MSPSRLRAVTDSSTPYVVVTRHDYFAFGEDTAPMSGDPRRFAGKELDAETALQYFGGRYYRAALGRLTSVDPVRDGLGNLTNPQGWNRYAYASNNPLRFVDPDGRTLWDVLDFVSAGASVVEFIKNPSWSTAGKAVLDVAGAALPIVPSPGTVRRVLQAADAVAGGAKAIVKRADDVADGARSATGVGKHAGESIPARSPGRDFTAQERAKINDIGKTSGCHSCGTTNPGTKSGNFVPAPNRLATAGFRQV